jgi:DNA-binding transcriptional MerR regulator
MQLLNQAAGGVVSCRQGQESARVTPRHDRRLGPPNGLPGGAEHPVYNTQAVVQLTGVPAPTFRAWERRYGVPRPARLPGGQRLYSERDVALIRWLHDRTAEGMTISRALRLLQARQAETAPRPEPTARTFAQLQRELIERLADFDAAGAEAVIAEAFALYPVDDVCLELFQPTLVEIGERWHAGLLSVAAEHFATHLIRRRLLSLLQVYETHRHGPPIVLACPAEEQHELGLLFVALFLARRAWPVLYLGASVPAEDLRAVVRRLQPRLVILSATTEEAAHRLVATAELLAMLPEPRPRLAYGGQAFDRPNPAPRTTLGIYLGPDARTAADRADVLLGAAPLA